MTNIYWPVYKNLEKELIELSNQIHFDDKQLTIYSVKITELLLRCSIEIESISKDLYFSLGGTKPTDRDLYFDTDCIQLLEDKWILSKKQVIASASNFHFLERTNQILTPLNKSNKRGSSGSDWKKAYQAVKHNRASNLSKGNLKNLIRAMAALFILNIYYKDDKFDLKSDYVSLNFNSNLGSKIFSIKIHKNSSISLDGSYTKQPDFDECIYLIHATEETFEIARNAINEMEKKRKELTEQHMINIIKNNLIGKELAPESVEDKVKEIIKKEKKNGDEFLVEASRQTDLISKMKQLRYEAVLNKNQID